MPLVAADRPGGLLAGQSIDLSHQEMDRILASLEELYK